MLALIGLPIAQEIIRRVAAAYVGSMVDGNANIAKVRFGFQGLRVERLVVWSPGCRAPLLSVDEVSAKLSLWNGIQRGIWLEEVAVDRPSLQLHYDVDGVLLSQLPTIPESETASAPIATLPFRTLKIHGARLVVHQEGRTPLDLDTMTMSLRADDQQLTVVGEIPRLFAGRCDLRSTIDIANLEASTDFSCQGLAITSQELSTLPLVPPAIHTRPWSASASLCIQQSGSIADLRELTLSLQVSDAAVSMADRNDVIRANGVAEMKKGSLVARLAGDAIGGSFDVNGGASFDRSDAIWRPTFHVTARCDGLSTDSLPDGLIPRQLAGSLTTKMALEAALDDRLLNLRGKGTMIVTETNIFGMQVAPTTAELRVDGDIDFNDNSHRSNGAILVTVISDGIPLDQLVANGLTRLPPADEQQAHEFTRAHVPKLPEFVVPSGTINAAARIEIPLASLANPASFLANGTVDATGVEVNNVVVSQGKARFLLEAGTATLNLDNVRLTDQPTREESVFSVVAHADLSTESDATAEVRLDNMSAAMLARLAGVSDRKIHGFFALNGKTRCQVDHMGDPTAWRGEWIFQAQDVELDDKPLANCFAECVLHGGELSLRQLGGTLAGGELGGAGELDLDTPLSFRGNFEVRGAELSRLASWATQTPLPSTEGVLDVTVNADGQVASNQWQARGSVIGRDLKFGSRSFEPTRLNFMLRPDVIKLDTPPKGLLGGNLEVELSGLSGIVRTSHDHPATTAPRVIGRLSDLPIPAIARIAGINERAEGVVSCEFDATSFTKLSTLNAVAVVESSGVAIRNGAVTDIQSDIRIQDGHGKATLSALGFGGEISLRADAVINGLVTSTREQWRRPSRLPINFFASASNIELRQLWPIIEQERELRPLQGTVNVSFERGNAERHQGEVAAGQIKFRELRWDNVVWSRQLQGNFVVRDDLIEVRQFSGPFAKGRISSRGSVSLQTAHRGSFEFTASRLSLEELLVPVDRRGTLARGLCSVRMQGRLGPRPSGRALVAMDRGTAGPIEFGSVRVPVDWSLDPRARSVQWKTTNAGLELGGGRVITNAEGRWNGKLDMSLTATARRVDTGRILHGNSFSGGGFLDGTMRLSAKRATNVDDFTGTFAVTLNDVSSLQIPVVSDLTKYLTTIPTTTTYEESRIQGRLGNGIVHLDRVTLAAANAQVLAEGTATLQGRLNLRVMARTGESGPADKLLELADSPLLMAAPTPLALVAKANSALKDRVIHLRISGTAARPAIHLEPGRQLGQEAIKFFMNQAIGFRSQQNAMSF